MMRGINIWAFPLSLIVAAAFCCLVAVCHLYRERLKLLGSRVWSVSLLGMVCVLTAVEGTWGLDIVHTVPFLLLMLLTMVSLGMAVTQAVTQTVARPLRAGMPLSYISTHLGLFLLLFGGFFGAPDFTSAAMKVTNDEASSYASTSEGLTVPLGFDVTLKNFTVSYYNDGVSPKQYTSILDIDGQQFTTSVGHPCRYKGWRIYQSDYDKEGGRYSVLKLVRDPWMAVVYLGMAILALGAVLELRKTWSSRAVIPVVLGLAVLFGCISMARINLGTLMPALRSLWFVPHLIIYMVAYSVLAVSLIAGTLALGGWAWKEKAWNLSHKLLGTASSLLIIGMLCGAAWAKLAWGDWWTWDAKECWAAVTWCFTLMGTHISPHRSRKLKVVLVLLAFAAMQVTWYGVNYLPSASNSMHTYNTK